MKVDFLFNAMDENDDGEIDFQEFLVTMCILTNGSPESKVEFAFRLLDLDSNGKISKPEFAIIASSMFKLLGGWDVSKVCQSDSEKNF